jgi:hypothetical protein
LTLANCYPPGNLLERGLERFFYTLKTTIAGFFTLLY